MYAPKYKVIHILLPLYSLMLKMLRPLWFLYLNFKHMLTEQNFRKSSANIEHTILKIPTPTLSLGQLYVWTELVNSIVGI